jgi:hypothetical protein
MRHFIWMFLACSGLIAPSPEAGPVAVSDARQGAGD